MPNLRERIEEILEQVLMKHHDDISSQDDDAIAEATEQILQVISEQKIKGILTEFHCPDMMLSQAIGQEIEIKRGDINA